MVRLQWHEKASRNLQRFCFRKGKPKPKLMKSPLSPICTKFLPLELGVLVPEVPLSPHACLSVPNSAGQDYLGSQCLQVP